MKVFISWSGENSHRAALILRGWLPSVIQAINPYVSSEDIDKGIRWSTDIAQELQESSFGILCITPANINAPWINFEAGAISKSVDKSRVSPLLLGIKRTDVIGPLLQFQSTVFEKEDVRKLLYSMNNTSSPALLEEGHLNEYFDVWWPKLHEKLVLVEAATLNELKTSAEGAKSAERPDREILEEILEIVRSQQRLPKDSETQSTIENMKSTIIRLTAEMNKYFVLRTGIRNGIRELMEKDKDLIELINGLPEENLQTPIIKEKLEELGMSMGNMYRMIHNEQWAIEISLEEARKYWENMIPK